MNNPVEDLARKFHDIYMAEAERQNDVRHPEGYDALADNIKEYDRVLARFVLKMIAELREDYENKIHDLEEQLYEVSMGEDL
jgi:hypothetical protein